MLLLAGQPPLLVTITLYFVVIAIINYTIFIIRVKLLGHTVKRKQALILTAIQSFALAVLGALFYNG